MDKWKTLWQVFSVPSTSYQQLMLCFYKRTIFMPTKHIFPFFSLRERILPFHRNPTCYIYTDQCCRSLSGMDIAIIFRKWKYQVFRPKGKNRKIGAGYDLSSSAVSVQTSRRGFISTPWEIICPGMRKGFLICVLHKHH